MAEFYLDLSCGCYLLTLTLGQFIQNSIRKLINWKEKKKALKEIIEKDKKTIKQLKNEDSLERFAREEYGHKKENETVFIIQIQDSIDNP